MEGRGMLKYAPRLAVKDSWLPTSTTFPWSRTTIWSAFFTVLRRCSHYRRHLALRNMNIHPVYRLSEGMRIILEHDVADMDARQRGFTKHSRGCPCTYRVQS